MARKMYEGNKLVKFVLSKIPNSLTFYPRKNPLLFSFTSGFKGEQDGTVPGSTLLAARRGPTRKKSK